MNACAFCKHGKRKCDKARPACSNCVRLRKPCTYTEDSVQTFFSIDSESSEATLKLLNTPSTGGFPAIGNISPDTLRKHIVEVAMQNLGSIENILRVSTEFFTGTHQRIPVLSRSKFSRNLHILIGQQPAADFATLCLCILLVQQLPSKEFNALSSLYFTVKNLISLVESTQQLSPELVNCKILLTFYELGHGLHKSAYISLAACARTARILGVQRKTWKDIRDTSDLITLEEEKRMWWAIATMDRFIGLCNGDGLFATDEPERADSLPIEDLVWSEGSTKEDIESLIVAPPSLDTPLTLTVGQMARECQISNLVGRVVRHVFSPTPDPDFNIDEAVQLERTLRAYLPLLAEEELRIGKYCAAFGMCNSALFILYDSILSHSREFSDERQRISQAIEQISIGAIAFSEASYGDRDANYPPEIFSPYLPYSLCQAAIIQHRLWKEHHNPIYLGRIDTLKRILQEFKRRWLVAEQYLDIIESFSERIPSIRLPLQAYTAKD